MKKVAVIMGSDSDLPVVEKAIDTLREFGVPMEVHVCSAHRTPDEASRFARTAAADGFGVLIAAAGLAAHLAGAVGAGTSLPGVGMAMAGGGEAIILCPRGGGGKGPTGRRHSTVCLSGVQFSGDPPGHG